jgi:hypothetical protein
MDSVVLVFILFDIYRFLYLLNRLTICQRNHKLKESHACKAKNIEPEKRLGVEGSRWEVRISLLFCLILYFYVQVMGLVDILRAKLVDLLNLHLLMKQSMLSLMQKLLLYDKTWAHLWSNKFLSWARLYFLWFHHVCGNTYHNIFTCPILNCRY